MVVAISFLVGGYLFITIEDNVAGAFAFVLSLVGGIFWGVRLLVYYQKVVKPDPRRWVKETLPRLVATAFFVALMIVVSLLVISSIPNIKANIAEFLSRTFPETVITN